MKKTLAEALLRRKELAGKVDALKGITNADLYRVVIDRKATNDPAVDEIAAKIPRASVKQIRGAYDFYAKQLRLIDAVIQKTNWGTEVEVDDSTFDEYVEPPELMEEKLPVARGQVK